MRPFELFVLRRAVLFGGALLAVGFVGSAVVGCHSAVSRGSDSGPPNFGTVNPAFFRGAQPRAADLEALRRLGVRTVINLRETTDSWRDEKSKVRALGMDYVAAPMRGLSAPTDAQVARVLELIENGPAPVFVHCEHGADRTGTIVACYRMKTDGWSAERALVEAKTYGFSVFQIGMRHYVRNYRPPQVAENSAGR
jgi:protein tyrosine/serine phosphatase